MDSNRENIERQKIFYSHHNFIFLLEFLTTYLGTYLIHAGIVVIKILELHSHATLKYGTFIG